METTENSIYWKFLKKALIIRKFEQKLLKLYSEGNIHGTVHTCIGQELTGVSVCHYLKDSDSMFSNHRGHGHFISKTGKLGPLLAEIMGKSTGICGGIGGSQHLYDNESNFYSSGIQGGLIPVAAGIALSNKLNKNGSISVVFIGDGTLGEGLLYEVLNIASLWNLPLLMILENNKIAQSTSHYQNFSGDIKYRIKGFGVKYFKTNVWDINDLINYVSKSVSHVRRNEKPAFLEIDCFRLMSHSKGDDNRDDSSIEEYWNRDLLNVLLKEYPEKYADIEKSSDKLINNALIKVEDDPELIELVDSHKPCYYQDSSFIPLSVSSEHRINKLINKWFLKEFANDQSLIIIGEDIEDENEFNPKPYGGAFKVTKNLSLNYGSRIKNTPISEAAIVGIGTGLAISGYHPIVEIMFGDFMTLAFDQIFQHAAKFNSMYNGLINVPLIIRTPMGGRRGYGPTHSQSIEKYFLGINNLYVFVLNNRLNPSIVFTKILKNISHPSLVIENKVLYTQKLNKKPLPGFKIFVSDEDFPTIKISASYNKSDITIVCYGEILNYVEDACLSAFNNEEIICEIIVPTQICPLNIFPILQSVEKTKRILVVEEGPTFFAWGSEVLAQLITLCNYKIEVARLGNNNIIPNSIFAEKNLLPNAEIIETKIKGLYFGKEPNKDNH